MKKHFSLSTLMGAAFIIAGLHMFAKAFDFRAHSIKTTGKVVAINSHDDDEGTTYHPVIAFTDKSGIVHTQRTSFGSSMMRYKPGDQVAIRYNIGTTMHVDVDNLQSIWAFPIFFTGMGVFFIVSYYRWLNREKLKTNGQATGQVTPAV